MQARHTRLAKEDPATFVELEVADPSPARDMNRSAGTAVDGRVLHRFGVDLQHFMMHHLLSPQSACSDRVCLPILCKHSPSKEYCRAPGCKAT